jgi:transcriptional regulator GlxA family with amidase domain
MSDQNVCDLQSVDRRVLSALKRLQANPELRVSDLAKLEGLSRSRLEYIIRMNLNTDIRSYKRAMRTTALLRAASDILESNAPLKCIQHDCGFNHRGHFIRCFRGVVGTTPADWRRHGSRELLEKLASQFARVSEGSFVQGI